MKLKVYHIILAVVSTGLLAGCASTRRAGTITTSPAPCVLTPDKERHAEMDIVFHVPEKYLTKRSRLVITPQLVVGDTVKEEYLPLVVDAPIYNKKLKRRKALENYADPWAGQVREVENTSASFDLPYRETVTLPAGADTARVVAVISTDGCGECTGIDTIDVASLVRPAVYIAWIEPDLAFHPKVVDGQGEASLQFAINRYDIDLGRGNNRAEMEKMLRALTPVLKDSLATVRSLTICGMASADGSLAFNTDLAMNRAKSAKTWLAERLGLTPEQQQCIRTESRPEGWQPVLEAMTRAGNPDSLRVKEILARYADENDDVQEYHIRRLPCWNSIRNLLSKDRKVEYTYTYTIRNFVTDSELLTMYAKRPDAFNEQELLRVSTLMRTDEEKAEVYRTILRYFPQSETALNNLAVLCLRAGREEEARELLGKLPGRYPDIEGKQLKTEGGE